MEIQNLVSDMGSEPPIFWSPLIHTLNKHSEANLTRCFNYNCRQVCLLHISRKSLNISKILFHCYGFHDIPTETEFFVSFQMLWEQVRESSHVCIVYWQRYAHQQTSWSIRPALPNYCPHKDIEIQKLCKYTCLSHWMGWFEIQVMIFSDQKRNESI